MSFVSQIAYELGLSAPATGYQIVDYNGEAVYVEGIRRVLTLTDVAIRLECKRAFLELAGEGLILDRADEGSIVVRGKVTEIKVTER